MSDRVFVGADFRAIESRLTALFSGDRVLTAELEAELHGGHKVHALNAAMIYGCAPENAKSTKVTLQGQEKTAYDGGKRLSHAWNYGMGEPQMSKTFWISRALAAEVNAKLTAKYTEVAAWRRALADRVFGVARFTCPRCGYIDSEGADCPECSAGVGVPIPLRFSGYNVEPARLERTAFGRLRRYPGRRREGQNALASQHPQSAGASMYNITLSRLHGYDPIGECAWPAPDGVLIYSPERPWTHLLKPAETFVAMGTYDSFYLETPREKADDTLRWLLWTMEQPWGLLDNWRFPAEGFQGENLGKYNERTNPGGLQERHEYVPFAVERHDGWQEREAA